jgi:hypothetical protein
MLGDSHSGATHDKCAGGAYDPTLMGAADNRVGGVVGGTRSETRATR